MRKRATALAVLAALLVGGAVGLAWPRGSGPSAAIRTWVGFVVVITGAGAALWQLYLQRLQLAEQQDVIKGEVERNKQRDALIEGQLRELDTAAVVRDRGVVGAGQADDCVLSD